MTFREYMQQLSDEELLKAFEELQKLQSIGVLPGGSVKQLRHKCGDIYGTEFSVNYIEKEVYYEMAMRYYAMGTTKRLNQ